MFQFWNDVYRNKYYEEIILLKRTLNVPLMYQNM